MNRDARRAGGGLACVVLVGVVAGCRGDEAPPDENEDTGTSGITVTATAVMRAFSSTARIFAIGSASIFPSTMQ